MFGNCVIGKGSFMNSMPVSDTPLAAVYGNYTMPRGTRRGQLAGLGAHGLPQGEEAGTGLFAVNGRPVCLLPLRL